MRNFMSAANESAYLLTTLLDDPRYEGVGFGDRKGVLGGSLAEDFNPKVEAGTKWQPAMLAPT